MKRVFLLFLFLITLGVGRVDAQCSADFNFTTNNLTANFQDSSFFTPNIGFVLYDWNFGDGNIGSGSNPSHTYANAGTYTVCLTISDTSFICFDTICKAVTVTSNQPPCMASFNYNIIPNGIVNFFSNVTGGTAPYTFDWDFGFGPASRSTAANPIYTYNTSGSYLTTLMVTDANGTTCSHIDTVIINTCSALFTYSVNNNGTVSFTNQSNPLNTTIPIINWNFGDGNSSSLIHPTHTYTASGTYLVTLNYYDSLTNCSATYSDTISVSIVPPNNCSAGFSYTVNRDTLKIIDSASNYNAIVYDFGDGTRSTPGIRDPLHIYSQSGTFTVCQYIGDTLNNCSDTICQIITISPLDPNDGCCSQLLDSLVNNPCQGGFDYTTHFDTLFIENKSRSTSISYDFDDGTTSTDRSPFHVYQQSGTYEVCQTVSGDGCNEVYCDSITIVIPPKCNAEFSYSFSGDTTYFRSRATSAHTFMYRFGDGSTSSDENPSHVYQSSGTYIVEQEIFNDSTFCADLFIDTIQVTVSFSCKAEFIPALDTSQSGVLFLINTSSNDITHNYLWDFGDSTTSSSRIPTHQFSGNRAYKICLTVSDSTQNCTSTFCDSIGLDTNGNILKTDGFILKIIEGTALSIGENRLDHPLVSAYPNPFRSTITLENLTREGPILYEIYSSQGQLIREGKLLNSTQRLSFDRIESGLYILHLRQGDQSSQIKLIKQ